MTQPNNAYKNLLDTDELGDLREIVENLDLFLNTDEGVEFLRKLYEPDKKRKVIESLKFLVKAKKMSVKVSTSDMKEFIDMAAALSSK